MNKRPAIIASTALAVGFALAAPAMAQQTETTETTVTTVTKSTPHHYMYYGEHDIYFAPDTKTYYWREGNDWRSGVALPPDARGYVTTGGVAIDLDTERPYERNEWVVQHYRNGRRVDDGDRDDHDHDHDH